MDRRKELQLQYKQRKPEMGIYMIKSMTAGKCYLQSTPDLKSAMNSAHFKLNAGMHPNRELQREWSQTGGAGFSVEVLERLAYNQDEAKTDYGEELELLELMWEEKLAKEGVQLYRKR